MGLMCENNICGNMQQEISMLQTKTILDDHTQTINDNRSSSMAISDDKSNLNHDTSKNKQRTHDAGDLMTSEEDLEDDDHKTTDYDFITQPLPLVENCKGDEPNLLYRRNMKVFIQ